MSEPFIGQIMLFAGNFAPRGWAFCNGQLLPISQNSALFSILGTIYGGNGTTTFALPDLQGRVPIQAGQGPGLSNYVQGEMGGQEQVTLISQQMPQHTHAASSTLSGTSAAANSKNPSGLLPAQTRDNVYGTGTAVEMSSQAVTTTVNAAGESQPHPNMQPYLAINYIIALQGVFPVRE